MSVGIDWMEGGVAHQSLRALTDQSQWQQLRNEARVPREKQIQMTLNTQLHHAGTPIDYFQLCLFDVVCVFVTVLITGWVTVPKGMKKINQIPHPTRRRSS